MSFKVTIALIVVAVISGVVFYFNPFVQDEEKKLPKPWFYQVHVDDMTSIGITFQGDSILFVKTSAGTWAFEGPGDIPPDHKRWGGIDYILGGPQTKRDLTETQKIIKNPAQYGLDSPHTIVDIGLTLDRNLQFRLGDKTTDGYHHYGQISGFPQLFLIADTWGDVVARLVTEPPMPIWYVKRDPETIDEVGIFPASEDVETDESELRFKREKDGSWTVKDYLVSTESFPVDQNRWDAILPLLSRPEGTTVAVPRVNDRDYSSWGIGESSAIIEIRFKGKTETGTLFTNGILLLIGNKTPDGNSYYGMSDQEGISQPVLLLPANWVETLLALYDDIPYAESN